MCGSASVRFGVLVPCWRSRGGESAAHQQPGKARRAARGSRSRAGAVDRGQRPQPDYLSPPRSQGTSSRLRIRQKRRDFEIVGDMAPPRARSAPHGRAYSGAGDWPITSAPEASAPVTRPANPMIATRGWHADRSAAGGEIRRRLAARDMLAAAEDHVAERAFEAEMGEMALIHSVELDEATALADRAAGRGWSTAPATPPAPRPVPAHPPRARCGSLGKRGAADPAALDRAEGNRDRPGP